MLSLLVLACTQIPTEISLTGAVFDDRHSAANPLDGATVELYDSAIQLYSQAQTDAEGQFSLLSPAGTPIYFELHAPGFVPTGFAATTGLYDAVVPDGTLWLESEDDMGELEGLFAGCATLGTPGGIIEGEIRYYADGYSPDEGSEWPIADTAWAIAYDVEGNPTPACYLNEEGTAYDPDAAVTGISGRFAIFGSTTGPVTLEVGYNIDDQPYWHTYYYLYVPESGVAPAWPMYVSLPGF